LNGLTGTLVNSPIFINPRTNRSVFNLSLAASSHISVTPINRTTTMSFEIWFNTAEITAFRQYLYTQQQNPPVAAGFTYMARQGIMLAPDILQVQFLNTVSNAGSITSATVLSANTWYHAAVVINGSNHKLFLNGVLNATSSETASALTVNQAFIGRRGDANGEDRFTGSIGLVRDYNRALTDQEVANNFNATRWRFGI
jgi:hypothetical protein